MDFGKWLYFYIFTLVFLAVVTTAYEEDYNDGTLEDVANLINRFKRMETSLIRLYKKSDCNRTNNRNTRHKSKSSFSWGRPTSYTTRYRTSSGRGWGHSRRFQWKYLPNNMCFRDKCKTNRDCCKRWNICDKSARRCRDCWYGQECKTEGDCCSNYPYCERVWGKNRFGWKTVVSGRCKNKV